MYLEPRSKVQSLYLNHWVNMSTWISQFPKFSFSKLNHGNRMEFPSTFLLKLLRLLDYPNWSLFLCFYNLSVHSPFYSQNSLYIKNTCSKVTTNDTPYFWDKAQTLLNMGYKDHKTKPLFNYIFTHHSRGPLPPQSQCWKQHSTIILSVSQSSHTFSWVWPSYHVSTY